MNRIHLGGQVWRRNLRLNVRSQLNGSGPVKRSLHLPEYVLNDARRRNLQHIKFIKNTNADKEVIIADQEKVAYLYYSMIFS